MNLNLTLDELEALLGMISHDMETSSSSALDYKDVKLMEYFTSRAKAYAKIKQALERLEYRDD